ncbi:MAG: bifunctional oligoribonuclease/PAP phosphatase NrnA [Clostridia bacterium]|nr:bifunctional oligoribonuclease/PAP phosphatase NrnA [Clostridia bacterium]
MKKMTIEELAKRLTLPKKTLILCHKNPDPDTLGSAYALSCILNYYGSETGVLCADGANPKFAFITGSQDITKQNISEYERLIAVDVASPSQLGTYEEMADKVELTIDHHEMNTRFSDYYENFCAACAQIIYDISVHLGIFDKLPKRFYECVYAGISGDTGCFRYSNSSPSVYICASKLVEKGIDFAEINRRIFDSKTIGEIRAARITYENMKLFHNGALAIIMVTTDMKNENALTNDDISDVVNLVRQIEGVMVAVSVKQSDKDNQKFTVSSRSNCDIDVSEICARLGGGGHKKASGASLTAKTPSEAFDTVVKLFSEAF